MQTQRLTASSENTDTGLRSHLLNVYGLVALGLGISAATAVAVAHTSLHGAFFTTSGENTSFTVLGYLSLALTFGSLIVAAVGRWRKVAFPAVAMHALYWVFTATFGVTLSVLASDSRIDVARPMLATLTAFAGLCIYGYTTKRDLAGVGSFCTMGLVGLVGVGFISALTGMALPVMAESVVGIIVFTGLTAWDAQRIKTAYLSSRDGSQAVAVWDAMALYLDALNLFVRLVRVYNGDTKS